MINENINPNTRHSLWDAGRVGVKGCSGSHPYEGERVRKVLHHIHRGAAAMLLRARQRSESPPITRLQTICKVFHLRSGILCMNLSIQPMSAVFWRVLCRPVLHGQNFHSASKMV